MVAFLIIFSIFAASSTCIFFYFWRKEKNQHAIDKVKLDQKVKIDKTAEEQQTARINELNRIIQDKSQMVNTEKDRLKSWEDKIYRLSLAYDAVNNKVLEHSADLTKVQEEKEKLITEQKDYVEAIEALKPQIHSLELELNRLKEMQRTAVLEAWKDKSNLWDLPLDDREKELISILKRIKMDYPDIKADISTIEWRKIWLPKFQDLGNREGLSCRGIYRLILKENPDICYVGQASSIQDRWYQHCKKMIGADVKGTEKLYNYRPEDFYWTVLEKGPQVDLDKSEHYWIEYFGCKEVGLNKKA